MTTELARSKSLPVASASVIAQREFVRIDTNGNAVEVTDGDAQYIAGVALEASANGDSAAIPVALLDGADLEVVAGAAISIGDGIIVGNDGRAYPHDSAAGGQVPAGTYPIVGVAKSAAGAAAEIVTMWSGRIGTVTIA